MEEYRIRIACFLILSFSIVLLASQGTSSSYLNKSWAGKPLTLDNEKDIKIQDNSDSDNDQDSEDSNQMVNNLTDQVLSGDEVSEDNNLTDQVLSGDEVSEDNNLTDQVFEW